MYLPIKTKIAAWFMRLIGAYFAFNSVISIFSVINTNPPNITILLLSYVVMGLLAIILLTVAQSFFRSSPNAWVCGIFVLLLVIGYQSFTIINLLNYLSANPQSFDIIKNIYEAELVLTLLPITTLILVLIDRNNYFVAAEKAKKNNIG